MEQTNEPDPFVCTVQAPTACTAPELAWVDVAPIFDTRCKECHTGASRDPWPLDTYAHVADWWDVVRDELVSCTMPPSNAEDPMLPEERDTILMWIRCGFPEE
jgi:uncharacterized membrane protein